MQFIGALCFLACTLIPCYRKTESQDRDAKCRVQVALGMLVNCMWTNQEPLLRLETKPKKKVFALTNYDVGQLTLIPYSESLVVDAETIANEGSRIRAHDVVGAGDKPVWIAKPPINFPKAGAEKRLGHVEIFWCVRESEPPQKKSGGETPPDPEAGNINMNLTTYRVLGAMAIKPESDTAASDVTRGWMHLSCVALCLMKFVYGHTRPKNKRN